MLQSVAVFLIGLFAYSSWLTATRRGLVADNIDEAKIHATTQTNLAEPLTALATIPFAFVGPIAWELAWFIYPAIQRWLRR